jgi:hypothetical protein
MSKQTPRPGRPRQPIFVETVTDPAEIAASDERSRLYKKTAAGQIGCWAVIDAPLPLLAQFVVELSPDDRKLFLDELAARLPPDALLPLADALRSRAAANGTEGQKPAVDGMGG